MCKIDGCDAQPVAKGLCSKHYMRARRHGGDATAASKRGRRAICDGLETITPAHHPEWSKRSRDTYNAAFRRLERLAEIVKEPPQLVVFWITVEARNKSGRLNISKFADLSSRLLAFACSGKENVEMVREDLANIRAALAKERSQIIH